MASRRSFFKSLIGGAAVAGVAVKAAPAVTPTVGTQAEALQRFDKSWRDLSATCVSGTTCAVISNSCSASLWGWPPAPDGYESPIVLRPNHLRRY